MSKFVIFSLLAVLAVANARGISGGDVVDNVKNNEIASLQQEGRFFLEVPTVSTIILKSLKAIWFLLSTICSVVDFKLAALALAVNAAIWAFSFKVPILIGGALILDVFKLIGLLKSSFVAKPTVLSNPDHLAYAEDYLDIGTLKYGKSS